MGHLACLTSGRSRPEAINRAISGPLTDPSTGSLEEVAFFDTHPENDGQSFSGAWSTYPFFESGVVLVSDISRGLFVLMPTIGPIFEDGFESGNTSAWDCQIPLF